MDGLCKKKNKYFFYIYSILSLTDVLTDCCLLFCLDIEKKSKEIGINMNMSYRPYEKLNL